MIINNRQLEIPKYARMVPLAEIEGHDFNLNLPRYIDSSEPEDLQDIDAHLNGGIPSRDLDGLAAYWQVFPAVREALFHNGDRPGYHQLGVDIGEVRSTIFDHPEFAAFKQQVNQCFAGWRTDNTPLLTGIQIGDRPKLLIETVSEALLEAFRPLPLLDPYDVYQHLMEYWAETMQDDVWMLVRDGWQAQQGGKPNFDLIPPELIVARYFAAERAAIEELEARRDTIARQLEELEEEHGGEEGLLAEAKTDKGKLTKATVKARLSAVQAAGPGAAEPEEIALLQQCLDLMDQATAAGKMVKEAQKALDKKVNARYGKLGEVEVKTLVVEDKWLATLAARVEGELERVSQALAGRIRQLAERYATPLPKLEAEVEAAGARVEKHLKQMGFAWN
ncbi:hypothetical protein [Desulfurivibrio alkaliphilus]|uniref:hypothetical protein n=1 Tax=Desulfurivibrio alkaliphilus TaxID=427923 RepID=UPI0002D4D4FB|nr:hypothetical protein [Desulfurivibrio alkaliphilus]